MKLIIFKEEGFAINIDRIDCIDRDPYYSKKTRIFSGGSDGALIVNKPFEEVIAIIDNQALEQEQATGQRNE